METKERIVIIGILVWGFFMSFLISNILGQI